MNVDHESLRLSRKKGRRGQTSDRLPKDAGVLGEFLHLKWPHVNCLLHKLVQIEILLDAW